MTSKEYYEFFRSEHSKANKLASEVVAMARERKVSIPMLVKSICEDYAASEADIKSTGRKICVKSAKTGRVIKRNVFKDEHQRHFIRDNGGFRQIQSDKYGIMEICGPLFERAIGAAVN